MNTESKNEPSQKLSVRLENSLKQSNLSLEEALNTEPSKLKEIGFGNRSIIELQSLKEEPKHIPYTGKVWEPPKEETIADKIKFQMDIVAMDFENGVETSMKVFYKVLENLLFEAEKQFKNK
jgi:hypothetical protein